MVLLEEGEAAFIVKLWQRVKYQQEHWHESSAGGKCMATSHVGISTCVSMRIFVSVFVTVFVSILIYLFTQGKVSKEALAKKQCQ